MNNIGDIVTGVYGLETEVIIYPHSSFVYTGLIINRFIKVEDREEYYELYCEDGKLRTFRSCEIIDVITHPAKKGKSHE
mgnify:CR=1 FL=1